MRQSAGTLLYRRTDAGVEVLLVHPSYRRSDPWSIPKGGPQGDESLEETARRETFEETGLQAADLTALGQVDYARTPKRVHCFAGLITGHVSPHCASWEVDRATFVTLETAYTLIHPEQMPFLDRLLAFLNDQNVAPFEHTDVS